ncbi:MAG: hypothetical protein JWN33_427 [Candidatus Saccharibacteria bacterium]|nr:hypothetical protein [Candidatus Saccharibacteria bacterium]
MDILLNPRTQKLLDGLTRDVPQSLLFTSTAGVDIDAAITYLQQGTDYDRMAVNPDTSKKEPVITVEQMRGLYDSLKTKTDRPRFIIINNVNAMTVQAQNAFLKLLEEPLARTHFLLIAHHPVRLIPTIRSRVIELEILPLERSQSNTLLDSLQVDDTMKRQQLLFIADGRGAELKQLATDSNYFEHRSHIIRDARSFIQARPFDALAVINNYKDDRTQALMLLEDVLKLLRLNISKTPDLRRIHNLSQYVDAYERIEANGNVRLVLTALVV